MENRNNIKNKIVIILLLIALITVVAMIITIVYINSTNDTLISKKKLEYINGKEWNNELFPDEMPKFYRSYNGKLTAQIMGKSIYYVATELIPEYYTKLKNLDDKLLNEFYNNNSDKIKIELGITTNNDFNEFIKELNKLNNDNIEFESFMIDKETIQTRNGKTTAKLHIKYKNCEELIIEITPLTNISTDTSPIIYSK